MASHPFKALTVVVTVALSVGVGLELSSASADTSSSYIETSQANPVSAQPAVTTPPTKSCTVTLASEFPSNAADGSPQSFSGTFTPPADCPGPWAKVVLTFSSSVTGRQFDRDASIKLGGAIIYFGTTQEPFGSTPKVATVSTDVTRFESLFEQPQQYSGGIGNYTSSVYTGVFDQTATLTFYEPDAAYPAPPEPNEVVGVPVPDLNPGSPSASLQLPVLPRNLTQADLEVTLKGNGCDEQWFTAVPNPVAAVEPYACGDGPYREADFTVDGQAAGALGTYPHIYSGGIVPALWNPVMAIDTLSLRSENLDLTPFVGQLVDGKVHTLGVSMPYLNDNWNVIANLFLWTDPRLNQTSGALTVDNVSPAQVSSSSHATGNGDEQAYGETASRHDVLKGYVVTSQGRIYTADTYQRSFQQSGTVSGQGLVQTIDQTDNVTQSSVSTRGNGPGAPVVRSSALAETYPLSVDFNAGSYVDDNNYTLEATVDMGQQVSDQRTALGQPPVDQYWNWTVDTYGIQARSAGVITALDGHSTTSYDGTDDSGALHHITIVTDHGQVVSTTGS